jgi:hypothetical protein
MPGEARCASFRRADLRYLQQSVDCLPQKIAWKWRSKPFAQLAFSKRLNLREVLGKLESLALVIGPDALPINLRRRVGQALEDEPADDLAMFQDKWNFA